MRRGVAGVVLCNVCRRRCLLSLLYKEVCRALVFVRVGGVVCLLCFSFSLAMLRRWGNNGVWGASERVFVVKMIFFWKMEQKNTQECLNIMFFVIFVHH